MKKKLLALVSGLAVAAAAVIPFTDTDIVSAEDTVIFSNDFEDGVINDWTPFGGGGKLALDTTVSHSGDNCLKVTERSEAYHGPALTGDSLLRTEKTYTFSAWAYQKSDSTKTITWTLKYTDSTGLQRFMQLAAADVPQNSWALMSETVTIPEDAESFLMYFECSNATVDFYIDDVVIVGERNDQEEKGTDTKGALYSFDFEIGNELWSPRGDNRLIRTDEHHYTGSHSIYVTNRNKTWNGPTVSVADLKKGVSYFYSAYVMYNGEEYEDSHGFRMEVSYNQNGETIYQLIKEQVLQKGKWTRIAGTYTLPEDATDPYFYIQTSNLEEGDELTENDLLSFYTDTVSITETSLIHGQTAVKALIITAIAVIAAVLLRLLFVYLAKISRNKNEVIKSAAKDAMTQCLNRNSYERYIEMLEKNPDKCKNLYFTLCDVNFLKYINDNLGHEKGDEAITRCGQLLTETVGNSGDVYRTGGDEFVCITTEPVQDRIRSAIEAASGNSDGYPFYVASGFAQYEPETDTGTPDINKIIERCDKDMYANKQDIKAKNADYSRK